MLYLIPVEIQREIFCYLTSAVDLRNLSLVCKDFRMIFFTTIKLMNKFRLSIYADIFEIFNVYGLVDIRQFQREHQIQFLKRYGHRCSEIKLVGNMPTSDFQEMLKYSSNAKTLILNFTNNYPEMPDFWRVIEYPNLIHLKVKLSSNSNLNRNWYFKLLENANPQSLDIIGLRTSTFGGRCFNKWLISRTNLKYLKFDNNVRFYLGNRQLGFKLKKLHLVIKDDIFSDNYDFYVFLRDTNDELEEIIFERNFCPMHGERHQLILEVILKLKSLKKMEIYGNTIFPRTIQADELNPNVKELMFYNYSNKWEHEQWLNLLKFFIFFPNLTRIKIMELNITYLNSFYEYLPHLEALEASSIYKLRYTPFPERVLNLKELRLSFACMFFDHWRALTVCCPHLKNLCLEQFVLHDVEAREIGKFNALEILELGFGVYSTTILRNFMRIKKQLTLKITKTTKNHFENELSIQQFNIQVIPDPKTKFDRTIDFLKILQECPYLVHNLPYAFFIHPIIVHPISLES